MDWHRQNDEIGKSSLLRGVGFAILCLVAMQWEVEYPHHNEKRDKATFSRPASGLRCLAVYSTRLWGVIFANGG